MSDQQIKVDTLRGELREEREIVIALEESKRDAERILSKKILELSERTAERDQLRQQVEGLLSSIGALLTLREELGTDLFFLPNTPEVRDRLRKLSHAVDQVRKELEGR